MSAIGAFVDYTTCLGWNVVQDGADEDNRAYINTMNVTVILSHIPVVQVIVGLWRIYKHIPFLTADGVSQETSRVGMGHIVRGFLEVFSPAGRTGLLVGDVAMTALRGYAFLKAEK